MDIPKEADGKNTTKLATAQNNTPAELFLKHLMDIFATPSFYLHILTRN